MPKESWIEIWSECMGAETKNFDQENAPDVRIEEGIFFQEGRRRTAEQVGRLQGVSTPPIGVRAHGFGWQSGCGSNTNAKGRAAGPASRCVNVCIEWLHS